MTRFRYFASALLLIVFGQPQADSIDQILGQWISKDGLARQEFVRQFDRHYVSTRMWFKTDAGWQQVSQGTMYRRPGDATWRGATRTQADVMDGVQLFEFEIAETNAGEYTVSSTVYMDTSKHFRVEEIWHFTNENQFDYRVFIFEDGSRKPLMGGNWVRATEAF